MTVRGETSSIQNPTVILIGGRMTLEDGEELDSRQAVEGDPASRVLCRALGESLTWWMTTSSLVEAILASQGQGAFALVNGSRTVVELEPGGEIRWMKLRSLLRGGVGTVRTSWVKSSKDLPEGYEMAGELPTEFLGRSRFAAVDVGAAGNRWRFLDGSLAGALSTVSPTVIVDTDPYFVARSFEGCEERRLTDGVTLVLPHTHAAESYLRGLIDWIRQGKPTSELGGTHWTPDDGSRSLGYGAPGVAVVSSGTFRVTGLYRRGEWQDPGELEAARAFAESRFDLRIGIWDLADNPSLRTSLLKLHEPTLVPTESAPIPKGSARRSALRESAGESFWKRRAETVDAILEQCKLLRPAGWEQDRGSFRRPITKQVQGGYGDPKSLAYLSLGIGRYKTYVYIQTSLSFDLKPFDLMPYLESKRDVLTQIASPDPCDLGAAGSPILWGPAGGWDSTIDWPERLAELRAKTPLWLEVFADLPQIGTR